MDVKVACSLVWPVRLSNTLTLMSVERKEEIVADASLWFLSKQVEMTHEKRSV